MPTENTQGSISPENFKSDLLQRMAAANDIDSIARLALESAEHQGNDNFNEETFSEAVNQVQALSDREHKPISREVALARLRLKIQLLNSEKPSK